MLWQQILGLRSVKQHTVTAVIDLTAGWRTIIAFSTIWSNKAAHTRSVIFHTHIYIQIPVLENLGKLLQMQLLNFIKHEFE